MSRPSLALVPKVKECQTPVRGIPLHLQSKIIFPGRRFCGPPRIRPASHWISLSPSSNTWKFKDLVGRIGSQPLRSRHVACCDLVFNSQMASNNSQDSLLKTHLEKVSSMSLSVLSTNPASVGLYGRWKVYKISWASAHSFMSCPVIWVPWLLSI